jgi:hypothetical protein
MFVRQVDIGLRTSSPTQTRTASEVDGATRPDFSRLNSFRS